LPKAPCDSAFLYLFEHVEMEELFGLLRDWMLAQIADQDKDFDQLLCDGKTLRGSARSPENPAEHTGTRGGADPGRCPAPLASVFQLAGQSKTSGTGPAQRCSGAGSAADLGSQLVALQRFPIDPRWPDGRGA